MSKRRVGRDPTPRYGSVEFATKHLYLSGGNRKFRVQYDRIVDFEPFSDGFEIIGNPQTARPQAFRTGDGWLRTT